MTSSKIPREGLISNGTSALYAETLAHVRSGDFEAARQAWMALEKEAMAIQPSNALADYIGQARIRLENIQSAPQEVGEFLARF